MGIMIIPTVSSISEDAMARCRYLREAPSRWGDALSDRRQGGGAARFSGIASAYILGFAAVADHDPRGAAGMQPNLTFTRLSRPRPSPPISAVALGDCPNARRLPDHFARADLMLFTLACHIGGHMLRKRFRETY